MFSSKSLALLCYFLLSSRAFVLPPQLSEVTGLSDAQLKALIFPPSKVALSPRQNNCTVSGTFAGPADPTERDIEKRNAFVSRQGTKLKLLDEEFRITGPNVYWLGLDENVVPNPSYPSRTRVLDALTAVYAMGGTAVRTHTLGVSFGNALSVEPSLDVFNENAYEAIDFAIVAARLYGLKLLIPLVDNYNYYHGGKYQFIQWHGIDFSGVGAEITPPDVGAYFYNTTAIVNSFKRYITHHLNHINQFTGVALKDEPTILGWESGNELSAARFGDGPAPPSWTKEIAELVKTLAPKHLFMDGSYGIFPDTGQLDSEQVDIFGDHFYPPSTSKLITGATRVNQVGRNYLAGEYDWTGVKGGDDLATWLTTIRTLPGAGDFYWSLFGRSDSCCGYVEHNDGQSFFYQRLGAPAGSMWPSDIFTRRGRILAEHSSNMSGRPLPSQLPALACPQSRFPVDLLLPGFHVLAT